MKVASFEIVFQEVPGEVTLALNISGCPNRCPGCHSPHLWEDTGEELTPELLDALVDRYFPGITCVCFMGGDQDPDYVRLLATRVHEQYNIKTAWYTGHNYDLLNNPEIAKWLETFDFVKTGPYIADLGGLKSPTTNQRFYARKQSLWQDETNLFRPQRLHSKT